MNALPHVVRAKYERGCRLRLTFNDGVEASVDFKPWLVGEIFEPLKKSSFFRRFFLDGGTVVWPNGADIAPETLYEAATRSHVALRSRRRRDPRVAAAERQRYTR